MSTNYYHREQPCEKCGRGEETHIGKSAIGWAFSFRAYPGLRTWTDWRRRLAAGGRIFDEYDREVDFGAFVRRVENSRGSQQHARLHPSPGDYLDPEGHSFSERWFS